MIKIILFYFLYIKRLVLDTKILPFFKYLTAPSRQIHCEGKFAISCHFGLERTSCNQQQSNQQQTQMILNGAWFFKNWLFKELAFQYLIKQTLNF